MLRRGDPVLRAELPSPREPARKSRGVHQNEEHTRQHHHEVSEVVDWEGSSRCELLAAVSQLNLLILCAGGVLYDGEGHRYLALVQAAHDAGVPVFAYAVGAGPLNDPEERAIARSVLAGVTDLTV
jgi:polysaccharide pyruvyl transferase WcaK-like protein